MNQIEQQFNSETPEQIEKLLNTCKFHFRDDKMVMNIIQKIQLTKNITFNQWKALKANLSKHNNPSKKI